MSFQSEIAENNCNVSRSNLLTICKYNQFLQTCPNLSIIPIVKPIRFGRKTKAGKAFFFAPFGSMTIEAALVIPLFLSAMISLLGIMEIFDVQMRLEGALFQVAKEMAVQGYAYERLAGGKEKTSSIPLSVAFSESYVRAQVQKNVTASFLDHSVIKNGRKGMLYSFSRIMEADRIELRIVYRVAPRLMLVPFPKTWTMSQVVIRAFTGYDPKRPLMTGDEDDSARYVYVTQCGHAYHKSRSCSHLQLSVRLADLSEIGTMRNEEGGRYRPCRICHASRRTGEAVLVTNLGDRYHRTVTCPGLKRTISCIPLREAAGYTPCQRCSAGVP